MWPVCVHLFLACLLVHGGELMALPSFSLLLSASPHPRPQDPPTPVSLSVDLDVGAQGRETAIIVLKGQLQEQAE